MNAAIPTSEQLAVLENQLLALLTANLAGFSEYQLLKHLRECQPLFATFNPREPLSLFRGHFLLFHVLYRLQERLRETRCGHLMIEPLRIVLQPAETVADWMHHTGALTVDDATVVGHWYADLERLTTVTVAEVVALLHRFQAARSGNKQRQAALAVLGLQDPVGDAAIKQRYRQLVGQCHPDRGGDGRRLCQINVALSTLEADFGKGV